MADKPDDALNHESASAIIKQILADSIGKPGRKPTGYACDWCGVILGARAMRRHTPVCLKRPHGRVPNARKLTRDEWGRITGHIYTENA